MIKFKKTQSKQHAYAEKETSASRFIPYKCYWNENTLITKDDELLQVIKVSGFSFETADDQDLDIKKNLRNNLFKGLSVGGISLYFHTIRRKHSILKEDEKYILETTPSTFAETVDQIWMKKQIAEETYVNELYITVINKSDVEGAAVFGYLLKKLRQKTDYAQWEVQMRELHSALEETTGRVLATLSDYNTQLLALKETEYGVHSEILGFLGKIVNCGTDSNYLVTNQNIDRYLCTNRLYFRDKYVEIHGTQKTSYAGIVSIKEYGTSTSAGLLDGFLHMPFELIITQSFAFANRQVAIGKMQLQQNRMIQAEDKAVSQIQEISEALDMAMSGRIGFGFHHLTVMCIADNVKNLEYILSQAIVELSNTGSQPIRETVNLEPCFWGQLPCNDSFIVRKATVNTLNLAAFASLHNYPIGKAHGNHWGDAVTILNTTSGTPYFFNFHLRDVGHTVIIGPTGAGKTVLMNFLCVQAQKFNCRTFFFDKDRGAEIFIRALNGKYTVIDPGKRCGFNPLKLADTGGNRIFLLDWFKLLVTTNGEKLTSEDVKVLNAAVEGNYRLRYEDRILKNVVPFLGIETDGSLASRIGIWYGRGSRANIFDNEEDTMSFTKANSFGFEMAELLKDKISLNPVLFYLFHRINSSLTGVPTMIVLDEAWALIDNEVFGPTIKDWLKVLRKLNAMVIFATQSVEDATKSAISDTLIQQTATQIFLPNLKATDSYRKAFMLSDREYNLIRTTDPASRFFLIKQGTDAIVARLDLKGMDDVVNVLSGRADTTLMLYEIMNEVGTDPYDWLPVFYQKCRELKQAK